jgi:hypothetical protein
LSGTSIAGTLTTAAQAAITSVGTLTNISTSGNANVTSDVNSARVSATGNITGGNLITGGVISAGGAITAPQAGSIIPFYFANTAVFPSAATYHGAVAHSHADGKMYFAHASNWVELVDVSSTQTLTNKTVSGVSATMTANVSGGNIVTAGQVSATGNITGSFFVGNGSLLTGIAAGSYGNANVAANLAAFGSNPISTTGNVTAGNFVGNVVGGGAGTPTISSATNLDLSAASAVRVIGGGTLRLPSLTTAQIANTIAANGDVAYNSTTSTIQGYEGGSWVRLSAGPIFMSYNSIAQSIAIGNSTMNLVYTTTTVNTGTYYNTTSGIFTPGVAGYYQVNAVVYPTGDQTGSFFLGVYKNGSAIAQGNGSSVQPSTGQSGISGASTLVYLNGTTDYINCKLISTSVVGTWQTAAGVPAYFQATWVHD